MSRRMLHVGFPLNLCFRNTFIIFWSVLISVAGFAVKPTTVEKATALVPHNISVVLTQWSPPAVRVTWSYGAPDVHNIDAFRIMYSPINSRYRYIQEVPQHIRNVTIERLMPNTEYQLLITAITNTDLIGNSSKYVRFISPDSEPHRFFRNTFNPMRIRLDNDAAINVRPAEVLIVVLVLVAWIGIIFLFIKKWGKIRTLEPTRSRPPDEDYSIYQHKPRFNSVIPQVHTSNSKNSINGFDMCNVPVNFERPRLNSVFLASPSRRNSLLPREYTPPRRYKSAEDLKSLVVQITQQKSTLALDEAAL